MVQDTTCPVWPKYFPETRGSSDLQKFSILCFINNQRLVIVNLTQFPLTGKANAWHSSHHTLLVPPRTLISQNTPSLRTDLPQQETAQVRKPSHSHTKHCYLLIGSRLPLHCFLVRFRLLISTQPLQYHSPTHKPTLAPPVWEVMGEVPHLGFNSL